MAWINHDKAQGQAVIVARLLDQEGVPAGPPRQVAVVTGNVALVDAWAQGDRVWFAWLLSLDSDKAQGPFTDDTEESGRGKTPEEKKGNQKAGKQTRFVHRVVAVHTPLDLGAVSSPIVVENFHYQSDSDRFTAFLRIAGEEDGSAWVISPGSPDACPPTAGEEVAGERGSGAVCDTEQLTHVLADGRIESRKRQGIGQAHQPLSDPTPVGGGFIGLRYSEDASASAAFFVSPKVPNLAKLNKDESLGTSSVSVAWNGEALIETYEIAGEEAEGGGKGERISVFRKDGRAATKIKDGQGPHVKTFTPRCQDGRPVSRWAWKGGEIAFDPGQPGASRVLNDLVLFEPKDTGHGPVYWLGHVAARLEQRRIRRWTCKGNGLQPLS